MTKEAFLRQDLDTMIQTLYQQGTFVVSIRYYSYKVNLYLLSNFFVEVFYNHKHDVIERIELLKRNNKRIKFYADQISLPADLLQG